MEIDQHKWKAGVTFKALSSFLFVVFFSSYNSLLTYSLPLSTLLTAINPSRVSLEEASFI